MTNGELAISIQMGDQSLILVLWEQARRFVHRQAKRRLLSEPPHMRGMEDDLAQEAYFGFLKAVSSYRESEASFLNYLNFHLKNSFNEALGARTVKGKRSPERTAARLDSPIDDAEGLTLQDILIDPLAEGEYRQVEDADFWDSVNRMMRVAIDQVASGNTHSILMAMLDENISVTEACRRLGLNQGHVRGRYGNALNGIRRKLMRAVRKRQFGETGLLDYLSGHRGVGVRAYRSRGFTSVTEMLAIRKADKDLRAKRLADLFS